MSEDRRSDYYATGESIAKAGRAANAFSEASAAAIADYNEGKIGLKDLLTRVTVAGYNRGYDEGLEAGKTTGRLEAELLRSIKAVTQ